MKRRWRDDCPPTARQPAIKDRFDSGISIVRHEDGDHDPGSTGTTHGHAAQFVSPRSTAAAAVHHVRATRVKGKARAAISGNVADGSQPRSAGATPTAVRVRTELTVPTVMALQLDAQAGAEATPDGSRFVERILTVVQTLKLQGRPVLEFIEQTVRAQRASRSAPRLLPL